MYLKSSKSSSSRKVGPLNIYLALINVVTLSVSTMSILHPKTTAEHVTVPTFGWFSDLQISKLFKPPFMITASGPAKLDCLSFGE